MTTLEFLAHLHRLDVKVWVEGDRLRCQVPKEVATPDLRAQLAERKEELLALLSSVQVAADLSAPVLAPVALDGELPLSFAQERLWFLDQLEPGNPAYNIPSAVRLSGPLDAAALEQGLNEIVRRHAALRTTFAARDGCPFQHVVPELALPLPVVDLRGLAEKQREDEVRRRAVQEMEQSFDLARGPLLRATLLRTGAAEHVLLLTMHHIVSDGWSMGILVQELVALYDAFSRGKSSPLPELPLQYADFAAWQRGWLQDDVLDAQIAYWRQQLGDEPPALDLPTDHPRPPLQTYRGAVQALTLPHSLTAALKALGQQEKGTLFHTLLAAFKVLLHRYTGQTDIAVGSPIAGRNRREIEGLIGFFLNTLVLRTRLDGAPGGPTFRELLGQVRDGSLEAYAHQDLPFEKLLEELQPQRDLSRTPLFQVFFNMLNLPGGTVELPDLKVENISPAEAQAKFDLTLYVAEQNGEILIEFVYNADLYKRARMAEMAEQFRHLLSQIAADPDQQISHYSLVTPGARAVLPDPTEPLRAEWKGAVHTFVARQAQRAPERPALVDPRESWTYGQLERRSNQLAHYLLDSGTRPQEIVAIYGHRSASLVWAVLGILKAGAAFLILDPAYPAARQVSYLRLANPHSLLQVEAAGALPAELQTFAATMPWRCRLALPCGEETEERGLLALYPPKAPPVTVGPEDLACVGFTSGSMGIPKGVLGKHGSLSNFLAWQQATFDLRPSDRYSMLSGLAHDPLQRDIFTSLVLGATLCIPDPEQIGAPGWLAGWMARQGITVAHLTPAMLQLLTQAPPEGLAARPGIPLLRWVLTVGDVLTRRDVARLRELAPAVSCVNLYGTTETQRAVGYYVVPGGGEGSAKEILPLGRGMPGVQLLVLNAGQRLASVGELGEIHVRSPHLARGYLGDEALTRERFVANPFGQQPGDRLYRTGDLGRYLPDGNVTYQGRADSQVKIRGFRIELGEIEAVLGRHPALREAVVMAYDMALAAAGARQTDRRLVAYIVPEQPPGPTVGELRAFLLDRLPDYMVPAHFISLDALPLTPNRKVDRRALPVPDLARPDLEVTFAAPSTPVEEVLAGIWSQVLGIERVGALDNFFALGGHSLLATQVVSRLRQAFQVEIPLRTLFERPTVAELAHSVEAARRAEAGRHAPPLVPVSRQQPLPQSFAQQRLWFLDQLAPNSAFYNMPAAIRLSGALDVAALAHSASEIVRRHETLRTTFDVVDGQEVQVIAPAQPMTLPVVDLSEVPEALREARVRQLAAEEAQRPFDLARSPLLRLSLLRLEAEEHVLLLTMHHIISDGWSAGVLVRELAALYQALAAGEPSSLAELPLQYADFAVWQRQWLQAGVLEAHLAYWREQVGQNPPVLELPTDRPRPPVQTYHGATRSFLLPLALSRQIEALGRQEGATLFMTLLAAFKALLHRYTGQADVVVGSPIANRNRAEIEGLIGFFVNTLVLRTGLDGDPTFRELLARVREVTLGAYAHQDLPFEKLVDELQPERDLSRNPLFQVMFVLQNAPLAALELPGLTFSPLEVESVTAQFDLTLSMMETQQGLAGEVEYNTDLFDAGTIDRLTRHLRLLLESIVAGPTQRLSELSFLAEAERRQLLVDWNDTRVAYPEGVCLHELFEAQVERTPEAVALVFEGEHLAYRELNRRANQLAHHLRRLGVRPEVLVGLCAERSLEMVIGLLGILKAGGAYVPLDPTYPPERLAFMWDDAQASILLTQERLRPALPADGPHVLCLDSQWPTIARESTANPIHLARPENQIYAIYTSGSTGKPKGAMNTHHGLCNRLQWMQDVYSLTERDCVLQKTPFSFDVSGWEFYWPLLVGARLVVARPEGHKDSAYLVRLIAEQGITTLHFVPSMLQLLLEEPGLWRCRSLRRVICSGEALPLDLQNRFFARLDAELHNLYGPTEAAIDVTAWACTPDGRQRTVPIGRPIANTQVYVLDGHLQPVPVGVPGELYLGGAGLARGYLHRPGLTAERFIPHPIDGQPGERLYRTGDLVRFLPDGNLEFLGRTDFQVKVRGFRIELGEIEAALGEHPQVREAVVVAREEAGGFGDKQLVTYLVAHPQPAVSELHQFLKARLPEHMWPSAWVMLDALPLTPSGKVDRRALPPPAQVRPELTETFAAPRNDLEERLAQIWSEVLGLNQVGIDDNFFELGGDSFKAIRVVRQLGNGLGVIDLFKNPTIREFAALNAGPQPTQGERLHLLTESVEDGVLALVCVPYGGGGAFVYRPLARSLPNYALYAVDLPGHDPGRLGEALQPLEEVAQACVEEIQNKIPGRLALYGHCLGVALTVEIARRLEQEGRKIEFVFLGGSFPLEPKDLLGSIASTLNNRLTSDEQLLTFLASLGGFQDVIDWSQAQFLMKAFRHDRQAAQAYFTQAHKTPDMEKLKAPIVCIVGDRDPLTEDYEERFQEWQFFSDSVELRVVEGGGHYFVQNRAAELSQIISHSLQRAKTAREKERSVATKQLAITNKTWVFILIWFGQLISLVGSGLTGFALAVWVYQLTGSVTDFALISFSTAVPIVLVSPFAGALVDRWDRRLAMILSDAGAALGTLTIWLLLSTGRLEIWHIYVATAFSSVCAAFQWPAYSAATTLLIRKQHLGRANGMIQFGEAAARIAAPAMAGALILAIQIQGVILIDLLTFLFALLALVLVRIPRPEATAAGEAARGNLWREAGFGWAYIKTRPGLMGLLAFFAVTNLTISMVMVLIIPLVLSLGNARVLGSVVSIASVGMLLGGLVMSIWGGPRRRINGVLGFSLLCGSLLLLGGARPSIPLITMAAFAFLFGMPIINGCSQVIWQSKVEPDLQGRVFAVRRMIALSSAPIAQLLAGPLADKVFEPLLVAGGLLATSVGRFIGIGPGRGIGLLFVALGAVTVVATFAAYAYRRIRLVEDELPDVVQDRIPAELDAAIQAEKRSKRRKVMRRLRKVLVSVGIILLALMIVAASVGVWFVRRPWTPTSGTVNIPGLLTPVEVLRDPWGVPHIYAQNEHDLFMAQGYVHAQDRLWQMEFNRRYGSGTLSAGLGSAALGADRILRTLGLRRAAEETWATMDQDTRAILEAYAKGVNAYIETHPNRLSMEFTLVGVKPEPWTPIDSLAWGNAMAMSLSGNMSLEILRAQTVAKVGEEAMQQLFPPPVEGTPIIIPAEASNYDWLGDAQVKGLAIIDEELGSSALGWGSNTWVVHGSRTASGKPILADDTHLNVQMPSIWYETGLHGGRFDCVGFSFPGTPLVIIGHNSHIAWGVSNLGPDTMDLYIEKLNDAQNPTQYLYQDEWHDLEVIHETIEVKGEESVELDVLLTNHGPIVNDALGVEADAEPMALRWTLYDGNDLFKAVMLLDLATNWDEFRDALKFWDIPSQNFVYADVEGNIGYQAPGRVPIRPAGHEGLVPMPGWTGEYEWQSFIPFDELPSTLNPPAGFIVAANNKVMDDDYPYLLAHDWFPGYRAKRISDLLAANDRVTVEDTQKIHAQTYSLPAETLRSYLLAVEPQNDLEAQALALVKDWDLYFEIDRVGASIYDTWYIYLVRNTIGDELGEELLETYMAGSYQRHGNQHVTMMTGLLPDAQNRWFDDINTPEVETRDDIVRRSLTDALEWLAARQGDDPKNWRWGQMHTVTFRHRPIGVSGIPVVSPLFNGKTIAAAGDQFSVDAASFAWNRPFAMIHGTSQRMIVDMGNFGNSWTIHTTGQSEHLFHRHREDFVPMWQNVEYHPMLFGRGDVDKNGEDALTLAPKN